MNDNSPTNEIDQEKPLERHFVEQAEYLEEDVFDELNTEHPEEELIVKKLTSGGGKLLVGPRGCGKTTLMIKAYNVAMRADAASTLPIYVNFKFSLRLEPLYTANANASYWFRSWLNLKVAQALFVSLTKLGEIKKKPIDLPGHSQVELMLSRIESGDVDTSSSHKSRLNASEAGFSSEELVSLILNALEKTGRTRCVILMDDAAHAFSQRQQEDFFDFFRQVKRREIAPKAAIYPGITIHSHSFQVGHDAEQIDVWIKPEGDSYERFMMDLAEKRFSGSLPRCLVKDPDVIPFLAYASFGIPRSFLNMLREVYDNEEGYTLSDGSINKAKALGLSKYARDYAVNVYEALEFKMPIYKNFVHSGSEIFEKISGTLKDFNRVKHISEQALAVGVRRPQPSELEKVLGFLQYAGLMMPRGDSSRGDKGIFDLFVPHFGALISDNSVVGKRTKTISQFVTVFRHRSHQAWPRISPDRLMDFGTEKAFSLSLAACQRCGTERLSEHSKFCHNCGAQLKSESLYRELVGQDIDVLKVGPKIAGRIKKEAGLSKISDILLDFDRSKLRSVKMIGPVRAARIFSAAEEYMA